MHHDQVGFIPVMHGLLHIQKISCCTPSHQQTKKKKKNHMILSIGSGKAFDKIQYQIIIKTHSKLEMEVNFLNLLNIIYKNL